MECPFLKSEGGCCFAKLANPVYAGVAFVVFNLLALLIDVYEIGIISLISYSCLLSMFCFIVHVKLSQFLSGNAEPVECQPNESWYLISYISYPLIFQKAAKQMTKRLSSRLSFGFTPRVTRPFSSCGR